MMPDASPVWMYFGVQLFIGGIRVAGSSALSTGVFAEVSSEDAGANSAFFTPKSLDDDEHPARIRGKIMIR
jgi:hypothetical protein